MIEINQPKLYQTIYLAVKDAILEQSKLQAELIVYREALEQARRRLKFTEEHGNYEHEPTFKIIDDALKEYKAKREGGE